MSPHAALQSLFIDAGEIASAAVHCKDFCMQHQHCCVETQAATKVPDLLVSTCISVCVLVCTGEKLSESTAGDVRELCTTLLNCYLIQLLETGFLHADPHPGNLIRTPEGQICILDFGLMTEVTTPSCQCKLAFCIITPSASTKH